MVVGVLSSNEIQQKG